MQPEIEMSLTVEYDELFSLRDRIRQVADQVRGRLARNGFDERFEVEVFESEMELRGPEGSHLLVRLDSFRLEITGAPMEMPLHAMAAIILDEAGVFRLASVEAGFTLGMQVRRGTDLGIVGRAFSPIAPEGDEPMLDRRFSMTWDWGTATTGFSFMSSVVEDREILLSFKGREGYMTVFDLQSGDWLQAQAQRFDGCVSRYLSQIGWK